MRSLRFGSGGDSTSLVADTRRFRTRPVLLALALAATSWYAG
jgi:hypothetical protein